MNTVIAHFHNEEYLLPWWIEHHLKFFEQGILINHHSTDKSVEIIKSLAPNWKIIDTKLNSFDAFLNDLEVMSIENEVAGWKIALNITEFLIPSIPLESIENLLIGEGLNGCTATGFIICDENLADQPSYSYSLPLQKHYGINDNLITDQALRKKLKIGPFPERNRLFHKNSIGAYHPGRHKSFLPEAGYRTPLMLIFHYAYAPWNQSFLQRKMAIGNRISSEDLKRGWGAQHLRDLENLESSRDAFNDYLEDLSKIPYVNQALNNLLRSVSLSESTIVTSDKTHKNLQLTQNRSDLILYSEQIQTLNQALVNLNEQHQLTINSRAWKANLCALRILNLFQRIRNRLYRSFRAKT